ncbi:MAG TPA: TauD/TfdA family dioxygenase [Pseudonocardiaceae bacterium]|jgi:alpha-ketoglutarate-dependent taurine dioxygenase
MVATNTDAAEVGYDPSTRTILSNSHSRLDAHTDGARGFSDQYPDLLALLCAQQAASGGESFMVDGQYLCDAIARDPEQRHLARFLWGVPIEQCMPMGDTPPESPNYLRSRRPVASRTPGGRPTVRYHQHQRALDDGPADDRDRAHLATWQLLGQQAAAAAPRFLLRPGELLSVDNYRVFHGREPYPGSERLLHRILAFTDMSFGGRNIGPAGGRRPGSNSATVQP